MAWFTAPSGAACVAAYDAVGASSLADSYVNEANPGTYTAAPGVAPTWAYGTGWTFNGTTQYLTTGITVTSNTWSVLVRFTNGASTLDRMLCGGYVGSGTADFGLFQVTGGKSYYVNNALKAAPSIYTSGVLGMAGKTAYINGAAETGAIGAGAVTGAGFYVGRNAASANYYFPGKIQALAIYSATLTLADVVAITAAMNALPVAASTPTMMQHHHAMLANRR